MAMNGMSGLAATVWIGASKHATSASQVCYLVTLTRCVDSRNSGPWPAVAIVSTIRQSLLAGPARVLAAFRGLGAARVDYAASGRSNSAQA